VQVLGADPGDEDDRDQEVAAVDPVLVGLADDDEDEQQVDEVIGGGHGPNDRPIGARCRRRTG
jgi:hypothetical protein